MQKIIYLLLQFITLVVFIGLVILLFITPQANALVWTLVIPVIPITLLVIGYSRWRIICPLAWFTKLTQNLNYFSKRKLPEWFEKNAYAFQFGILFIAFTARLYVLNSDALMLAGFFIIVITLAMLSGLFLSGKSWCNFLCPVGVVEKIYTGSNSHMSHVDSACGTCTACKKNCPDIDMESSYWKETSDAQKRFVFYAFPGLVLGFYLYYFLEAGTWDYYFGGSWAIAHESDTFISNILLPGFYFLPQVPKLLAVPITLFLYAYISYCLFAAFEKLFLYLTLAKEKDMAAIQHITKVFAAFIAFNIFYIFAGAPTFSQYPYFYAFFHFMVIALSAILLWKEIHREEKFFIQERFARKILKKWTGTDVPSKNLKEIYYTYANQQKDHDQYLENYKETILELMGDGILTQESMILLDKMRSQLGITTHEHKTIINSLEKEYAELFEENSHMTAEKLFQLKGYKAMLKITLEENKMLTEDELEHMRKHFQIDMTEHMKILNELMNSEGIIKEKIFMAVSELSALYKIKMLIPNQYTIALDYFKFNIEYEISVHILNLEKILPLLSADENILRLIDFMKNENSDSYQDVSWADEKFQPILIELALNKGKQSNAGIEGLKDAASLVLQYEFKSLYSSLLLVLLIENIDNIFEEEIECLVNRNNTIAIEVANILLAGNEGFSTIQKEALLHSVPLFNTLSPEYIGILASNVVVKTYSEGEFIVREGDAGDALYVISKGSASILIKTPEGDKIVARVSANDYIGEIAIFSGEKRTASVQANEPLEALEVSVDTIKKIIYYSPGISFDIMRQMTLRLLELTKA